MQAETGVVVEEAGVLSPQVPLQLLMLILSLPASVVALVEQVVEVERAEQRELCRSVLVPRKAPVQILSPGAEHLEGESLT